MVSIRYDWSVLKGSWCRRSSRWYLKDSMTVVMIPIHFTRTPPTYNHVPILRVFMGAAEASRITSLWPHVPNAAIGPYTAAILGIMLA